ncbi:biopolymer transporter ExbD, partial [bacterium]|nr:biopolymer transporter ExbD [bacterium]
MRNKKHLKKDYRPIPDINITALVDVVLVLLIVFMIAAPMLKSTVDV